MRTIIELPDRDIARLGDLCQRERISRAEAIRRAVTRYLREYESEQSVDAFGLWRDRDLDAQEYVDKLRDEW